MAQQTLVSAKKVDKETLWGFFPDASIIYHRCNGFSCFFRFRLKKIKSPADHFDDIAIKLFLFLAEIFLYVEQSKLTRLKC
jgi:hypothetical protein